MKVYIVARGERCEGYRIRGVYATREGAFDAVKDVMGAHKDDYRVNHEEKLDEGDECILYLEYGCDYIVVYEEEVTVA